MVFEKFGKKTLSEFISFGFVLFSCKAMAANLAVIVWTAERLLGQKRIHGAGQRSRYGTERVMPEGNLYGDAA